jgi:hypothetical protein
MSHKSLHGRPQIGIEFLEWIATIVNIGSTNLSWDT